ncbi:hypothetical protein TYRP_013050 [Tyrophagus putrescentiae]|nr:hypothetical protein TYRP_013050 [Tyrophagus putrescentiae]
MTRKSFDEDSKPLLSWLPAYLLQLTRQQQCSTRACLVDRASRSAHSSTSSSASHWKRGVAPNPNAVYRQWATKERKVEY